MDFRSRFNTIIRNRASFTIGIFTATFVYNSVVQAAEIADPTTLLSAHAQGRGGATAASSQYQDSLFQNPASAVFTSRYAVSASYLGWGNSLAASIVDTQSGPVGGGVYYVRRELKESLLTSTALGDYARTEEHMGFSLMGKLSSTLGFGTNIRYAYRKSLDPTIGNGSGWNFDVGAKYLVTSQISIGVVAQNLMEDQVGVFPKRYTAALEVNPWQGMSLSGQIFRVSGDNLKNGFTLPNATLTNGYSFGAEYMTPIMISARAGYTSNPNWNQKLASFGVGYSMPEFTIDYAFQKGLEASVEQVHTFSVTGYF